MSKRSFQETDFTSSSNQPSKKQKTNNDEPDLDLLDLIDNAEELEALDKISLQTLMKSLKECIKKNEQQRSKFGETPLKFRESEIALNDVIQELSLKLPESPHLYHQFVSLKGIDHLLTLLMHENIDIVSTIIGLIKELSEADNYLESESAIVFVVKFIQQNGIQILLQNMQRLHDSNIVVKSEIKESNDSDEDDSQTIFAILSTLENISEIDSDFCTDIVKQCKLFKILLNGMRKKRKRFDEILLYLSEILCIYLQPTSGEDVAIYSRFAEIKGCDKVLDLLNCKYLRTDPTLSEEKEYVCNLCDALSNALGGSVINQNKFAQSPNAMRVLIGLIKSKMYVKQGCLQALSFAVTNHRQNCVNLVENGGIKTVFAVFMNRKKIKKKYRKDWDSEKMEEYVCCVLVHLFCNLSDVSLLRLMRKFSEKEFEKIERLVELHSKYMSAMEESDLKEQSERVRNEIESETFAERYSRRLDNGLYTLQMIDILIGFVYTFDSGDSNDVIIRERIVQVLNQNDMDIDQVKVVLKEYFDVTHDGTDSNTNNKHDSDTNDDDMSLGSISGKLVKLMQ